LGEGTESGGDSWLQTSRVLGVVTAAVRERNIVVEDDFLHNLGVSFVVNSVDEVTELVSVTSTFPEDGHVDISFGESGGVTEVEDEVGIPSLGGEKGRRNGLSFRKEALYGGNEVGWQNGHISIGWVVSRAVGEWWCRLSEGANNT